MVDFSIDIQFYCAECGVGICNQVSPGRKPGTADVEMCPKCKDKERGAGYDEGYAKGYDEGYAQGYDEAKDRFDRE
jgi:hypothetical protein